MKIDERVKKSIRSYLTDHGYSATSFAKKVGVSPNTVTQWINVNGAKEIRAGHWVILRDLLGKYLPDEYRAGILVDQERDISLLGSGKTILRKDYETPPDTDESPACSAGALHHVCESDATTVPVLGSAAAADYAPMVEPVDDYARGQGDEVEEWLGYVGEHWFTLRIEGDSMSPKFPHGTLLLVGGGEFPQNEDIVVARIADAGEVVCKKYRRKDNHVTLESLNPAGRTYEIDLKTDPGRIIWLWPVIEVKINLRTQRWEKKKNGK